MNKYVSFIYKYKVWLLVLFLLSIIGSVFGMLRLQLNTDFALFTTNSSVYEDRLEEMEDVFGSSDQLLFLTEYDTFDDDVKTELRTIQAWFEEADYIAFVQGPTPERITVNNVDVPIDQIPAAQILTSSLLFEEFSPITVVDDTYYVTMTLLLEDAFSREDLAATEEFLDSLDIPYYLAGDSYNQYKIVDYIISILFFLPPLAILIILIVFRLQLGAVKPTFLSVFPAVVGSILTFGIIGWLGNEVSILTAVVPIFIIVIGSADGLHFISHMQDALRKGNDTKTSLGISLRVVGVPMIITTLTSMAGFLSLLSMDTDSVVDLAVFAALGIFIAGIATWFVLPLILSLGIKINPRERKQRRFDLASPLKRLWGIPSIVIALVFILVGVIFFSNISNEFDMLSVYKDSTVVATNAEKLDEVKGGSIPLYIVYEHEDVLTLDAMNEVDAIIDELRAEDLIQSAMNPYRILQLVFANDVPGGIPNNLILEFVYNNVSNNGSTPISEFMSPDDGVVRIAIFPTDMNNDTLEAIEHVVETQSDAASMTGIQYLLRELNVSIGTMQRNSIAIAIGIVFLMLVVSLRSFKLSFISTLPILITVGMIYGVMGITGIPLNITTVIIFSIAIGVGIDYAVHFSSVYEYYNKQQKNHETAINETFDVVSKPVLANALGIALGLSVMIMSPLMIHTYVSVLMWVAMIVSVLLTLTLIPSIIILLERKSKQ